ncbi:LOG family protein [Leptothrix discophora]|uniref:Cytokinin riboside 5'-monophosphate phosphoribohydrolase n=1 Tax=Leptothrix discophora TaxID=89 RepID=A0ABT9G0U3_LEPDI|nr:TIGR00730 family Rossman fold protein [Leptothrix discophora]MDP4300106.1 TIGR00730 family Rossman fold protein [Leptothrix discophora]
MSPARPFSICVYCGSRLGAQDAYADAARALGTAIARRGWRLVYGGGNVGLMGQVADAALAAGGQVCGVIPDSLMRREVGHRGLQELHVVDTMHARKQRMAEASDAFVALPGGIGTLEELFEVWTWRHLGYHDKPVALLEVAGYWQPLLDFMQRTQAEGFVSAEQAGMLVVEDDAERLLDRLAVDSTGQAGHYRRI